MKARREVLEFSESRMLLTRLRIAAHGDGADPKSFALLLGKAAQAKAWLDEGFTTFTSYVTANEPRGLGMTKEQVKSAAALAGPATVDLVEGLLNSEVSPARKHGRPTADQKDKPLTFMKPGPTAERYVARLKREARSDPAAAELAAKVIGGEVKPNAAARQMGWRKPRIVLAKRETVAGALIKHMPRDALRYIADELDKHLKEN